MVGQTIGGKLAELGHEVMVGTRDAARNDGAHRTQPLSGLPPFSAWLKQNPAVQLGTFAEAAQHGEFVFNATNGMGSLEALQQAGEANLNGKILMDISNPLDFSQGMPPTLSVCNTDSLGEQIQRAFPSEGCENAQHRDRQPDGQPAPARRRRPPRFCQRQRCRQPKRR